MGADTDSGQPREANASKQERASMEDATTRETVRVKTLKECDVSDFDSEPTELLEASIRSDFHGPPEANGLLEERASMEDATTREPVEVEMLLECDVSDSDSTA